MVEIEEVAVQEEDLNDLSVTQLKKRMREKGIDASGCTEKAALIKRLEEPGEFQRAGGTSASTGSEGAVAAAGSADAPEEEAQDPMAQLGQMGRQLVMLPVLWGSNKIDWENATNVLALQVAFGVVLAVSVALLQLTLLKAAAAADERRVEKPGDSQHWSKAEDGSVSYAAYDSAKAKEARGQLLMGGAVCAFLHLQWGYMQPLLMTCVMNLFHLWDCKAVHVHILGKQVERPWAAPASANPLQQWAERKKAEAEAAQAEAEKETKKSK